MTEDQFILPAGERPDWVEYPQSFHRILRQSLVDLTPWHIMEARRVSTHFRGLSARYPSRALFPFACRQDNDDVACWSKGEGEKVLIIHDFASPGWEDSGSFEDVWSWFRHAVEETIDWE